jgi:hypothetical protein
MIREYLEYEEESWKMSEPTADLDDEPDPVDEDVDIYRVPRSGKRRLYPVERLR